MASAATGCGVAGAEDEAEDVAEAEEAVDSVVTVIQPAGDSGHSSLLPSCEERADERAEWPGLKRARGSRPAPAPAPAPPSTSGAICMLQAERRDAARRAT